MTLFTVMMTASGVSAFFGVLALFARLFLSFHSRNAERGPLHTQRVVPILDAFGDDAHRLAALRAIAELDARRASAPARRLTICALLLLGLALTGLGYCFLL